MSYSSRNDGYMTLMILAGIIYGVFKILNTYITGHFFLSLLLIIGVVLFIWLFSKLIKTVYKSTPYYKRKQNEIKQNKEKEQLELKKYIEKSKKERLEKEQIALKERQVKLNIIRERLKKWRDILDTAHLSNSSFRIATDILANKKLLNGLKECYINHDPNSKYSLPTHYLGIKQDKNGLYVYSQELMDKVNDYEMSNYKYGMSNYELDLEYELQKGNTTPEEIIKASIRIKYDLIYYNSNEYNIEFETDTVLSFEEFYNSKVNTKEYRDELLKYRNMIGKNYSKSNNGHNTEPYDGSINLDHDSDY